MILGIPNSALTEASLLVGEGQGDAYFFDALCKDRKIEGLDFDWPRHGDETGGLTKYERYLRGLLTRSGIEKVTTLVVAADNDESGSKNFDNMKRWLGTSGFPVPEVPKVFAADTTRKVAILMLPDTGSPGCLETLLLESWRPNTPDAPCVDAYCECTGIGGWPRQKRDKARLRYILTASFKDDPERSLAYIWGKANNPLQIGHNCFDSLAAFLRTCV